jgi:RNase H-like domain found in reverse transcriptase
LALIMAVSKWKHYLLDTPFTIKTDQISLKHLLEQKIHTSLQHRGFSKLLGFDYTIEYKKDVDNKVVDALSRRDGPLVDSIGSTAALTFVSEIIPQWVTYIQLNYHNDPWIAELLHKAQTSNYSVHHLTIHQGVLRWKGRICVGTSGN